MSEKKIKKVGIQMYSIRNFYYQNPAEAFKFIKDCGYDAVEMYGDATMSAEELKKLFDDAGLECCGWHSQWHYMAKPDMLEMFASYNKVINNNYLIIPWIPPEVRLDREGWLKTAEKLNEIAKRLKDYGMYTGLHSHADEFKFITGDSSNEYPWDIIAKNTVNDVVLQLDMGNTYHTGVEPVAVLKKYPQRAQTVHIKPFSLTKGSVVQIGEDDIDWVETVKFCEEQGNTDYYIVEYGDEEDKIKSSVKKCLDNFKKYL